MFVQPDNHRKQKGGITKQKENHPSVLFFTEKKKKKTKIENKEK